MGEQLRGPERHPSSIAARGRSNRGRRSDRAGLRTGFAAAGASIWSLDLSERAAERAIDGVAGDHHAGVIDVADQAAVATCAGRIGAVDSVVYAAGLDYDAEVIATDWQVYRKVMAVNLDGAFHVAACFAPAMIDAARGGAFVYLSSVAGLRGEAGAAVYCASKYGLIGMVASFAAEMTSYGIRANAVCPGSVDSPMLRRVADDIARRKGIDAQELYQAMSRGGAAQRFVKPDEVADTCLYLASPAASAVTGSVIRIDCGSQLVG